MKIGWSSNGAVPPIGSSQYSTWRSMVIGMSNSASSFGAHAPGQITTWPAV